MRPRVLFVNRMLSMVRGGGETFDLEMGRHLSLLGCDVTFLSGIPLSSGGALASPQWLDSSAAWKQVRTPYLGWFPWEVCRGAWRVRWMDFVLFEKRAVRWAMAHRSEFDVVQVCELPTFVAEWKRMAEETPVVMRVTAPDYYDPHDSMSLADVVIASGTSVERVRERGRADCANVSNGVDTEMFKPAVARASAESERPLALLYVARFQSVKRHDLVLEAMARLLKSVRSAHLTLVGSGPLMSDTQKQAFQLGLADHVDFLGEVAYEQLPTIYAKADVKIIASDYESFCFAALEGMASGLPLVVSDTEWVPRLIDRDRGGRVFPVGDAAALCEALIWMNDHPADRAVMGEWNRENVIQHYGWAASAETLCNIYQSLTV